MEINVGDYVRFKKETYVDFLICKIVKIDYNASFQFCCTRPLVYFDKIDSIYLDELKEMITKHSKDIIDLIEVGDYVNGYRVVETYNATGEQMIFITILTDKGYKTILNNKFENKYIKSILTYEQFEANAYKIEKEV